MPVTVSRDPFARTETVRTYVPKSAQVPCHWCGKAWAKYTYASETDGGRSFPIPGVFCSLTCCRTYHE